MIEAMPLVAILRGIQPQEVVEVGLSLLEAGIQAIEVPLNSPEPFRSIERLVEACGGEAICGAGTVTSVDQVDKLVEIGAKLVVSPHTDPNLIEAVVAHEAIVLPGVATATEAFTAIGAGATKLKLFPAGDLGSAYVKSLCEVIPKTIQVFAVGHLTQENLSQFWQSGARGFGIGSGIYKPGDSAEVVFQKAKGYVEVVRELVDQTVEAKTNG